MPPASSVLVCAGHPRDMGQAQGEALRGRIREATARAGLPTRRSRWPSLRPLISGPLRGRGAGRELFRHFAHQAERLEGLALGADLPLDSLLALHLRAGAGALEGLALEAADWIVRESRPVVGFRSLERTLAWLVPAVAGVNEAGLALMAPLQRAGAASGTGAGPDARALGSGTAPSHAVHAPALLLVQDCLARFEHLAGALDWCRKRPAEGAQTLAFADASGGRGTVVFQGCERRVESIFSSDVTGEWSGALLSGAGEHGPIVTNLDPVARRLHIPGARAEEVGQGLSFGFDPLL